MSAIGEWVEESPSRTRNSKRYCDSASPQHCALDVSTGALHYRDELGIWQDIDKTAEEEDPEFEIKWTKLPYVVRMAEDSRRRVYPNRNDLSYWVEVGKPFPDMKKSTREGNEFTWDFTHSSIQVIIGREAVKLTFLLKDKQAPTSIIFPYSSQGVTRQDRLLLHNGEPVAEFIKPTAIDVNGINRDCDIEWNAGDVTISFDITGLAYPIEVDPTLNISVVASADDDWVMRESPSWDNTLGMVRAGNLGAGNAGYGSSMRFLGVNIPVGATVSVAYLTLVCAYGYSDIVVRSDLCCENSNNPGQMASYADHIGRVRTVPPVAWDGIAAWTTGTSYQSDDFASQVQIVVDGNTGIGDALIVFWEDKDLESDVGAYRVGASWDNVTYEPPELHIEYEEELVSILGNRQAYDGYRCFMQQYIKNKVAGSLPLKLPDGTLWE